MTSPGGRDRRRADDAGFTLIEVVIALALFALIGLAGVGLVTTVLDVRRHTAGRLERLGDVDRAAVVVTRDLTEIADAPLVGSARGIAFDRHAPGGVVGVAYRFADGVVERVRGGVPQRLLDRVGGVRWRYFAAPGGWQEHWPASAAQARVWPAAVAVEIDLAGPGPGGTLRRVVDLPTRPLPPGTADAADPASPAAGVAAGP